LSLCKPRSDDSGNVGVGTAGTERFAKAQLAPMGTQRRADYRFHAYGFGRDFVFLGMKPVKKTVL